MASAPRVGRPCDRSGQGSFDELPRQSCAPPPPRFRDPACSPFFFQVDTPMETSRPAGRTSEESAATSTGPLRSINLLTSRCDHPGASTSFKRDDTGLVSSALAMRHRPASLRVEDLGLPPSVVERFGERGVKTTYAWQRGAIDSASDGSNLVFCAPTSGGKSLVAEVLLVKALMRRGRQGRALFVLPFHSLVNEKSKDLEKILAPMYRKRTPGDGRSPVAVRAFAGETEGAPLARPLGCPGRNEIVAVTTIEKASVTISEKEWMPSAIRAADPTITPVTSLSTPTTRSTPAPIRVTPWAVQAKACLERPGWLFWLTTKARSARS